MLSANAIETDRRLEKARESTAEALMRHRWHWTLDESNPERVSINEYARDVGRARSTIQADANGYALYSGGRAGPATLGEARERANMGAETQAATEAVADARGIGFQHTRQERAVEVKRVREIARERAEQEGTSVEQEAPKVARAIARADAAAQAHRDERKGRSALRYVEMEGKLTKAQRALMEALEVAHSVPWGDEERELLTATVSNVRALLNLVDLALVGNAEIDWDAELSKLAP